MNGFRQRLQQGEVLLGQMVLELFSPGIGAMLAACGMDFVIFDMEHGRCDITLLAEMVASCRGSDIFPIARVPDARYAPLSRVLDVGARAAMVPRVETKQQAEDIVSQLKYAPMGRRGVALGIAHDIYQAGTAEFFAQANEEIAVIVMLETETAFQNLDEIIGVPGIDVAWVGHYDLTVSLGIPAQFEHPRLLAAMDALVAAAQVLDAMGQMGNLDVALRQQPQQFRRRGRAEGKIKHRRSGNLGVHQGGLMSETIQARVLRVIATTQRIPLEKVKPDSTFEELGIDRLPEGADGCIERTGRDIPAHVFRLRLHHWTTVHLCVRDDFLSSLVERGQCRRHGVAPGFLPPSPEAAVHWIGKGFRALSLGSDIGVYLDGVRRFRDHVTGKKG